MAVDEQYAQVLRENRELQERADFLLAACRDVQDMASCYGWALKAIADMDPTKQRAYARAAVLAERESAVEIVMHELGDTGQARAFADAIRAGSGGISA